MELVTENRKTLITLIIILVVLGLGGGIVAYQKGQKPPSQLPPSQLTPTPSPKTSLVPSASTATLVYGLWEGGQSVIKALNADGSNHVTIAKLPSNIKDVNIFSDHELLYIAETDNQDHGKTVNLYDLLTGQTQTLLAAAPGFGIDDLVLSPDKTWLATWEVKFAPGATVLVGGQSRVYTHNLANPQNKILIVSESDVSATNYLRYPLFFDTQGRLFLDTFGPNGGGWNRGLWVASADGTSLNPVPGMADGQYSLDPLPSPDGTKIVFTAYDSSSPYQLPTRFTSEILRTALANPNLLQLMDLANFQKTTLLGSADGAQYSNPLWAGASGEIFFQRYRLSGASLVREGTFNYNLSSGALIVVSSLPGTTLELLGTVGNNLFWGLPTNSLGNLGRNYGPTFSAISLTDLLTLKAITLLQNQNLQFIASLGKPPGTALALNVSPQTFGEEPTLSLKLKSFQIKEIAKVRSPQQNVAPPKKGVPIPTITPPAPLLNCKDYIEQINQLQAGGASQEEILNFILTHKCADSPLYLYPEKETQVTIQVKPPAQIISSNPTYNDSWQVLAYPDGRLKTLDGKIFSKISYDYLTSPLGPPETGLVVKKEELGEALKTYGASLGLAGQEIADFVLFWQKNLPAAPYYLISHYNQAQSQTLMPLEISPRPDLLIQVVMYFKPLEKPVNANHPIFEKIPPRLGFVAVDWSGLIDLP